MSFDKFKKLLPKNVPQPEDSDDYFKMLANLQEDKPKSKVIPIITTVAAAVAIVAVVSLWAIIGRGIRNESVIPATSVDPYSVELTQTAITDEMKNKISSVFINEYFATFLPEFDKNNPLTNDKLSEFCSWMLTGSGDDSIITKKELKSYVYDIFNINVDFESDIQSKRMQLVLMDMASYHPIQYMVSEELPDSTSVAMVALKCGSEIKYIKFVQKSELELEYILSVTTEQDTTPIVDKNYYIKFSKCREIFDLVADYRIDAMPEFSEGQTPDKDGVVNYAVHLHIEDVKKENSTLSGDILNKVAKEKFGVEYDLNGQKSIKLEAQGIMDFPLAELLQYEEQPTNEGTKVSATVAIHNIWPLVDYNCKDYWPDEYEVTKTEITQGVMLSDTITNIIEFSYITKDGKTPDKFLSCKKNTAPSDDYKAFFK